MTNTTEKIIPTVGMGATMQVGSDAYPFTIHKVSDDLKKIWVSEDKHHVVGGPYPYGADIPFTYSNSDANEDETKWELYTLRKNGRYVRKGDSNSRYGLSIGHRRYYQDPSF